MPPSLNRPRRVLPEVLRDEAPPPPFGLVVPDSTGGDVPGTQDAVNSGDVDVQWAMTFDLVESEADGSQRDDMDVPNPVDDRSESRDADGGET